MTSPLTLLRRLRDERRQVGWRGLLQQRGWWVVTLLVAFYLVRDALLYIVIPMAAASGLNR
jgi:hypothetical protein